MKSNFKEDLSKEELLGIFLDDIYPTIIEGYQIERISDIEQQHRGIDLIISRDGQNYFIDEKAQLDYLNKELPTFAFEISYLKNSKENFGWLYDKTKQTHKYFLITGIFLNNPEDINEGFQKCIITSVDRVKLIALLKLKGLDIETITKYNDNIRSGTAEKNVNINELNSYSEGRFYYSKSNKSEQPINLVLYLDFLIRSKVAKRIY